MKQDKIFSGMTNSSLVKATTLALIPKVKCPANVGDYRPIACCFVVYKTITKLIFMQLGRVILDLIAPNQGSFITKRRIISNILLCQDLVKRFNRRNNQSPGVVMKTT